MDNNKDDRNLNYINTPIQFKENKILPKSLQKTEASRESHRKLQIPPDFPSYTISTRPLSAWDEFLNLYLRPSVIKKMYCFFSSSHYTTCMLNKLNSTAIKDMDTLNNVTCITQRKTRQKSKMVCEWLVRPARSHVTYSPG